MYGHDLSDAWNGGQEVDVILELRFPLNQGLDFALWGRGRTQSVPSELTEP